jgi:cell division protease FtsH
MSRQIGMIAVPETAGPGEHIPSESLREAFDAETQRIVSVAFARVEEVLRENRDALESLVQALLEHETLDEAAAYEAAGMPGPPAAAAPV